MRKTPSVNPDTWQVETVKVDELKFALRLLDAFHLTFTSTKHLFMLERASVTTAQAHTCISWLRRISMEWCMWWLQQQCGQQQLGQLFGVLVVVRVVAVVLVCAIGRGSEAAERSFGGLVRVGELCSRRVILASFNGSCASPDAWFRTLGGSVLAYALRCARTYAVAVAAWRRWRSQSIARPQTPLACLKRLIESVPTRVCRMSITGLRMLKSALYTLC